MPCKSRCPLITFMPNKPDIYGIKFWVVVDVSSKYVTSSNWKGMQHHLRQLLYIFATSQKACKRKISVVGTMRKNRRELPREMTKAEKGSLHSSNFFWNNDSRSLFVKYYAKPKETVCLLSTMHQSPDVDQSTQKEKPKMILFHNKNKVGVDCFDLMARLYTTRTASRR